MEGILIVGYLVFFYIYLLKNWRYNLIILDNDWMIFIKFIKSIFIELFKYSWLIWVKFVVLLLYWINCGGGVNLVIEIYWSLCVKKYLGRWGGGRLFYLLLVNINIECFIIVYEKLFFFIIIFICIIKWIS